MTAAHRDRGVTLLELTAVLAIFSIVSVLALQLLSSALFNRAHIEAADRAVAELTAFAAVLRRDFEMSAPIATVQHGAFEADPGGRGFRFVTASARADLSRTLPDLDDVTWDFDAASGVVSRNVSDHGNGFPGSANPMLKGVRDWQASLLNAAEGWQPARTWRGDEPWSLPKALEVRFDLETLGEIRLVIAR